RATNYRRELDLDAAVATVRYTVDGVNFERTMFASHPGNAIIIRITADKPGAVSFAAKLDSPHKSARTTGIGANEIGLVGKVEEGGIQFQARVRVVVEGRGTVNAKEDSHIVDRADAVTLILVGVTNFINYHDISADPRQLCDKMLQRIN